MQAHQQRVIDEEKELSERVVKLSDFMLNNPLFPKLPMEERVRLREQERHMCGYRDVLRERIRNF